MTGVKTGTTAKAGGCLVTSFAVGPNEIVAVVLGSDVSEGTDGSQDTSARFAETRALLDAVKADYLWLDPTSPGVVSGLCGRTVGLGRRSRRSTTSFPFQPAVGMTSATDLSWLRHRLPRTRRVRCSSTWASNYSRNEPLFRRADWGESDNRGRRRYSARASDCSECLPRQELRHVAKPRN